MTARHLTPSLAALAALACIAALPARAVDPNFRVYADEFPGTLQRILATAEAGPTPMTTLGSPDAVDLESRTTWDFSSVTGQPAIYQTAPVSPGWSCYVPDPLDPKCGFDLPGNDLLIVRDNLITLSRGALALDFDGTGTFFQRAQAVNESERDATADENRLCFNPSVHPNIPYLVFGQVDGARRFMRAGDTWQSAVFSCNTDPLNVTQGSPCPGFAGGQSGSFRDGNQTLGRATGRAIRAGTMTLPSGHVVDALLVELLASFNVRLACFIDVSRIRLYQLGWLVPHHGFLAQITSPTDTASLAAWTTAESTAIAYGLLPALDVTITGVAPGSISVSWDPGRNTSFVDEWIVQWSTQPGTAGPMPFDSERAGDTIPAGQTSYSIRGLLPDTDYHVTVIAKKVYADPVSGVTTAYRSIAPPLFIGADVNGDGTRDTEYPVVRMARTPAMTAGMAVNESVFLTPAGAAPPVASAFQPACAQPPHAICPDRFVPGPLPMTLSGEALPSGSNRVTFYDHSDPTTTMRLAKSAGAIVATP